MRLTDNEIGKIKEKYGVDTLWSWSRLEKARNYLYEFYLTYIAHVKEDRMDCVYGVMGGLCHDILEKLYNKELQYEDMWSYFDTNWTTIIDVADLKFDRNDPEKNRSIAAKYKENLSHFFNNHSLISNNVITEQFILTKFADNIIFQGYMDAVYKDDDGIYNIIDFKTSTKYSSSAQKEKCGQLVCYAFGLSQLNNIPLTKIKIGWNFLKYVSVSYMQANGSVKVRDIERREIGKNLASPAKMWLKKYGYEDQATEYLSKMELENSIDCLPDDVKEKFTINDCYVYVKLTDELISYWKKTAIDTVTSINEKIATYNNMLEKKPNEADKVFYDSQEDIERESYYYATLSGYSPNLNKPYKMYLNKLEEKKNGVISFDGVGSDLDDEEMDELFHDVGFVSNNMKQNDNSRNNEEEFDLSWLDELD